MVVQLLGLRRLPAGLVLGVSLGLRLWIGEGGLCQPSEAILAHGHGSDRRRSHQGYPASRIAQARGDEGARRSCLTAARRCGGLCRGRHLCGRCLCGPWLLISPPVLEQGLRDRHRRTPHARARRRGRCRLGEHGDLVLVHVNRRQRWQGWRQWQLLARSRVDSLTAVGRVGWRTIHRSVGRVLVQRRKGQRDVVIKVSRVCAGVAGGHSLLAYLATGDACVGCVCALHARQRGQPSIEARRIE